MSKIKVVSKLKEVNFLEGLKRLKTFFELLDKHYPVLNPNDLEKKRAEAKKALKQLEKLYKDSKDIKKRNVCDNRPQVQSQF
jgi:hypothetical protein